MRDTGEAGPSGSAITPAIAGAARGDKTAALVKRLHDAGCLRTYLDAARHRGYLEGLADRFDTDRPRHVACRFLLDALAAGPCPSASIHAQADAAGIARRTLRRAADTLGIQKAPLHGGGPWLWRLPESKLSN